MTTALILGANGKPYRELLGNKPSLQEYKDKVYRQLKAKYDAAQTSLGNTKHWTNADNLDPHASASLAVRQKLRSRSRYELIENNPYLKGIILTIANDFVGTTLKLQVTHKKLSLSVKREIEEKFDDWFECRKMRQKLWRGKLAKMVDGETILQAFYNPYYQEDELPLDFQVLECDRLSNFDMNPYQTEYNEIDGLRFDNHDIPLAYHILRTHPGSQGILNRVFDKIQGDWIPTRYIVHWFRQERGWLRGIPELTTSLPLCAILRRYTMAVLRHAELAADFTGILETDGPANQQYWTDEDGNLIDDNPFDTFPIEMGMIANMPYGYKLKQLNPVPTGVEYDQYTSALLREITRPLLIPFNLSSGSSKDSNMASGIVDIHIYKAGQEFERKTCEENVLDKVFGIYMYEASRDENYFTKNTQRALKGINYKTPKHDWGWSPVGIEHTDPQKVANALISLREANIMTDRQIQETLYNRNLEDWQEEITKDNVFRQALAPMVKPEPTTESTVVPTQENKSTNKKIPTKQPA